MAPNTRLRWAVRTGELELAPGAKEFLLASLPPDQRALVVRHSRAEDQRRALAARFLERAAAAAALGLPLGAAAMKRTRGGKPYVANDVPKPHASNWNFSVSHEGDYVILASEPLAVCGCDVAAPQAVRRPGAPPQPLRALLRPFERQLTRREWEAVWGAGDAAAQEEAFRKLWALKEAFVKATGEGLGFDLGLLQFEVAANRTATVSVRGEPADGWAFFLHDLGRGHWAAVARAPPAAVVDAWGGFKATFRQTAFGAGEWEAQLRAPEPAFSLLTLADLLSAEEREAYEAAGGELL